MNKNKVSISERIHTYVKSEVKKELDKEEKGIDPILNIFGHKMKLSTFDRGLKKSSEFIDDYIIKKLLSLIGISPSEMISGAIDCFKEKDVKK